LPEVLFSTLGMTDPIRNDYDGPLLHILRHYRPQKAYLFMTGRICEIADQDDRYLIHARRLCEYERFACEFIELRYEKIDNPHNFEIFYSVFKQILNDIHNSNPGCGILINLSSGTPQMMSACQLLSLTAAFPVKAVQVTTPHERENYGLKSYDLEKVWANNIDNHPEMEPKDRTIELTSTNLRFLFLREAAISNIKAYNYTAALNILQPVQEFLSDSSIGILRAARNRKNMELREAEKEAKKANYDMFPIKSGNAKELFEYLLLLGLQQKSEQLMDFVRGISPALTRLFEAYLEEKCNQHIKMDYCIETPRGSGNWKIMRDKLRMNAPELLKYYDNSFQNEFRDGFISCATLLPMIEFDYMNGGPSNEVVLNRVKSMRNVEEKIRNPAAHSIKAIKEEEFKIKTGTSSNKLLQDMQWLFKYIYPNYFKIDFDIWASYDIMNREIINRLKT